MTQPATPLYQNRAFALAYAKRGWPVFPLHEALPNGQCTCGAGCSNPGKHPRTRRGLKDASTDPGKVNAWWTDTPDAPIGIVCGDAQDLLVVDIDPRNGGDETWDRLIQEHGPTPTVRVRTGGGGEHLYFRAPKTPIKSRGNALGPGVDISSNGHYVVAPPSLHTSGARYEFATGAGPGDLDPAPCPDWIVELANRPRAKTPRKPVASADTRGWLAVAFEAWGKLGRWNATAGAFEVCCPWQHEHSDGRGDGNDSSTVIFPPSENKTLGWWKCEHAHCSSRSQDDVRNVIPDAARKAANKVYPPRRQVPTPQPAPQPQQPFDPETGESSDPGDWMADLLRHDGKILGNLSNAIAIVTNDERWQRVLVHDQFADRILLRKPPWDSDLTAASASEQLADEDAPRLSVWLHRKWAMKVSPDVCWHVLQIVAKQHGYHPVRDYLSGLTWDNVPRCHRWTVDYLGADDTPYHRCVGLRWLISAIARVVDPGCQADAMLILEGDQGIGKSRAARTLASADWYCDDVGDLRNKDSADALRGKWIVEIGELVGVKKADVELQKAYLSRRADHYRPAYARVTIDAPRQCVFVGSTNADEYHTDPTGARRFWAVRCGAIDLPALTRDRDQLWAEALHHYRQGEPHWLQPDEVPAQVAEQENRREVHPLAGKVLEWCEGQVAAVTIERIIADCLEVPQRSRTLGDARMVGGILRAAGWRVTGKTGPRGAQSKVWSRP